MMTTTAEAATAATTPVDDDERKRPEPPPIGLDDSTIPSVDLLDLGKHARVALREGKMPRHQWFATSPWVLVMNVIAHYRLERARVLRQRAQLRQLHAKLLQLKGELLGKAELIKRLKQDSRTKDGLLDQLRRNR